MRFIVLVLLFYITTFAFGVNISSTNIQNGKSLYIEFDKDKNIEYKRVIIGKNSYKVFDNPIDKNKAYSLIPISYYEKPDTKELKIEYMISGKSTNSFLMLEIEDGSYKKEKIKVNPDKVNPQTKEVKARTAKEYKEAMEIYHTIGDYNYIKSDFIMPLDTKITSEFGKARVYNNSLRGYHGGTDFRAKKPTPIKAANDGKVVLAKNRFYAGNSVIVDHGHGVYSCYYHLSKFKVKKGEMVKKGQVLGVSGSTGRVTGPHLHFAIRLAGIQVDPVQFVKLINKNLFK